MSAVPTPTPRSPESVPHEPKPKKRHRILWSAVSVFVLLAGLAIYAAVHQGVRQIDLSKGTISFQNVSPSEVQQRQPEVKSELAAANNNAETQGVQSPTVPDISGYWLSSYGYTYFIRQYGDRAVMEERSAYGITAIAEGVISQSSASFNFKAINGSAGQAYLYFQGNGTIAARFDNSTYGMSMQTVLSRQ